MVFIAPRSTGEQAPKRLNFTLMALSKFSLADILAKAKADQAGTIYSITPVLRDRKPEFAVLVAVEGKSVELHYDLITGERRKP
jgi:hypothetical protein